MAETPTTGSRGAAASKRWRESHHEQFLAWQRAYYAQTAEKQRAYHREWEIRRDQRKKFTTTSNRHARARGLTERIVWDELPLGPCTYCGTDKNVTWDHATPLSRGGLNLASNCVRACRSCNAHKRERTFEEFTDPVASAAWHAAVKARKVAREREYNRRWEIANRERITEKRRARAAERGHW